MTAKKRGAGSVNCGDDAVGDTRRRRYRSVHGFVLGAHPLGPGSAFITFVKQ